MIQNVSLIGTGNIASLLSADLIRLGFTIECIWGRDVEKLENIAQEAKAKAVTSLQELTGDLVLICVTDTAIPEIIDQLPTQLPIAYTSGSVELSAFKHRPSTGVFYPLQSFSKEHPMSFKKVPILIEGNTSKISNDLFHFAQRLSPKVHICDSQTRRKYHLTAVWLNNFINHIAYQAKQFSEKENLEWDFFKPLILETMNKMIDNDPFKIQTGPARRNDLSVINAHSSLLDGIQKEIYELISNSIQQTYHTND